MWPTLIISALIVAIVVAIVVCEVRKKKQGKGSCSCGGSCGSCGAAGMCHPQKEEK